MTGSLVATVREFSLAVVAMAFRSKEQVIEVEKALVHVSTPVDSDETVSLTVLTDLLRISVNATRTFTIRTDPIPT